MWFKRDSRNNVAIYVSTSLHGMEVHILDTIKLFLLVKYWIKNKLYKNYSLLWTYNFDFLYNLFLIQYFTKRNNFMVSSLHGVTKLSDISVTAE